MARKKLSEALETEVLVASRRRCAMCFGLEGDTEQRNGQIAHLDRDASNDKFDNLCYLCLTHHDSYDSTRSQSKSYKIREIKLYRASLYNYILEKFPLDRDVAPSLSSLKGKGFSGFFERVAGFNDYAEIIIDYIGKNIVGDDQYHLQGVSLYGTDRENGPNTGDINIILEKIDDSKIIGSQILSGSMPHFVQITLRSNRLIFEESNFRGAYGMGVDFNGEYLRIGHKKLL